MVIRVEAQEGFFLDFLLVRSGCHELNVFLPFLYDIADKHGFRMSGMFLCFANSCFADVLVHLEFSNYLLAICQTRFFIQISSLLFSITIGYGILLGGNRFVLRCLHYFGKWTK